MGLYEVAGDSMLPTYRPGDYVLIWRFSRLRPGVIVVARVNGRPVIKRVKQIEASNLWLEGDNAPASTDSRQYGWIDADQVIGRVVCRLPAPRHLDKSVLGG